MTLKPAAQHRKSSFSTADSYRIPMPVREILELPNGYRAAVCPRCKCTLDREYQRFCDIAENIEEHRVLNVSPCHKQTLYPEHKKAR